MYSIDGNLKVKRLGFRVISSCELWLEVQHGDVSLIPHAVLNVLDEPFSGRNKPIRCYGPRQPEALNVIMHDNVLSIR